MNIRYCPQCRVIAHGQTCENDQCKFLGRTIACESRDEVQIGKLKQDIASLQSRLEAAEGERAEQWRKSREMESSLIVKDAAMSEWRSRAQQAEEMVGRAEQWKKEQLAVAAWWLEVDAFVRKMPECGLGKHVSHETLRMLKDYSNLKDQLNAISEALPDDSPSRRTDITGHTVADDVVDLVKANDRFQKLCNELRQKDAEDGQKKTEALKKILTIKWGYDGDCGAVAIAEEALSTSPPSDRTDGERLELPKFLLEMADRLRTQDNLATSQPLYCVFKPERVYGFDGDGTDHYEWREKGEWNEATEREVVLLERKEELGRETKIGRREFMKSYYIMKERFITASLTRAGAEEHLRLNGHNLPGAYIYVTSLYRTPDMIQLREWVASLPVAENEGRVEA